MTGEGAGRRVGGTARQAGEGEYFTFKTLFMYKIPWGGRIGILS